MGRIASFFKFLNTITRRHQPNPNRPLLDFYYEDYAQMTRAIDDHLNKTPLVCLALACPEFHNSCFTISIVQAGRVAVIFSTNCSPYYDCHDCRGRHLIGRYWFRTHFFTCKSFKGNHLRPRQLKILAFDYSLSIPFDLARRTMNCYTNALRHEFPVEQLVPRDTITTSFGEITHTKIWRIKVVDETLVLVCYATLKLENDDRGPGKWVDMGSLSVCRHVNTGRLMLPYQVPPKQDHFRQRCQPLQSCRICETDYATNLVWERGTWAIEISSYHILDPLKLRWGWTWDVMSYCPEEASTSPRYRELLNIPKGLAMHKWRFENRSSTEKIVDAEWAWAALPESHGDPNYLNRHVFLT